MNWNEQRNAAELQAIKDGIPDEIIAWMGDLPPWAQAAKWTRTAKQCGPGGNGYRLYESVMGMEVCADVEINWKRSVWRQLDAVTGVLTYSLADLLERRENKAPA